MRIRSLSSNARSPRTLLLGLLAFLCLLTLAACGGGNAVEIYDNAGVLNHSKVQRAANDLSNPVAIYTTSSFRGNQADFRRSAVRHLNGDSDRIVIAIDTTHRYLYIARGSNVPISGSGINQAVNAFAKNYGNGNYTAASTAAIDSLRRSTKASSPASGGVFSSPLTLFCCIVPLLLLLFLALFGASRRNRLGGFGRNRGLFGGSPFWRNRRGRPDYERDGPYNQPDQYNQGPYVLHEQPGPYNQGREPYYGPSNQGRGGMNPWAAGGLGAAAGGLAGWMLGRREGEREGERGGERGDDGNFGDGSFGGGENAGSGGSFGGGGFGNEGPGGGGQFGGDPGGGGGFGGGSFGGGDFDSDNSGGGGNF